MTDDALARNLDQLNEQLRELRTDIANNYAPRREIIRQRRRTLAILAVVLAMLLTGGWVTSRVTLEREHRIVAECFLLPSRLKPAKVTECDRTFPGYSDLQKQSARNLQVFTDLQRRMARLEAEQKKH